MLDIRWIRENPKALDEALAARGEAPAAAEIIALDDARRAHIASLQDAQTRRNAASKQIGEAKASGDEAKARDLIADVARLKSFLQTAEDEERRRDEALEDALARLPNLPLPDVPVGADETANRELRRFGTPEVPGPGSQHFELGEALGMMDFEAAARIAGSRFTVLSGPLARLERALGQFMLDLHTDEHGYREIAPPLLVRSEAMFGTAQLPKFAEDSFQTTDERWLIPTAEVPLTNLVRERILEAETLPLRVTALSSCFRSEAGSAGRDTRGMLRQHQFSKVELVSIVGETAGEEELERMTSCAEDVLKRLELPFRSVVLSTGDMGFGARKTIDIEVWLPGQKAYREISSCSYCGDFQARRMNARYREGQGLHFVHTLNGSGTAVGRALIAVMENYQDGEGRVAVPEALRPYMGGLDMIKSERHAG